jgi:small-conductance mechanosensitive channel
MIAAKQEIRVSWRAWRHLASVNNNSRQDTFIKQHAHASAQLASTTMPIPLISHGITEGLSAIPHFYTAIKWTAVVAVVALLKYYFGGARNTSERLMHSKVVMITVSLPLKPTISDHLYSNGN